MNISFYIAKRYALSLSKSSAINIITAIASMGIIVSAMALFVVLSVFSGLKEFSLGFSNSTDPDLKVFAKNGKSFVFTKAQEEKIRKATYFDSFSKIVEERVAFIYEEKEIIATLKGVDKAFVNVTNFKDKLYAGAWLESQTSQAVVGEGIRRKLSIGLMDFNNLLEVIVPKPKAGVISSESDFKRASLIPVGVYTLNDEIDNKFVYCDVDLSQQLLGFKPNQLTNLEFKIKPDVDETTAIASLNLIFNNQVTVKTRAQLNDSLYKMLNTENIAVYLIFTLVIIIALFNLIGALIMMIIDKKNNLKTLFNLGVEVSQLRKIFFFQGSLLTFFGGLIGLFVGIGIVVIQQQFNLIMVNENLPYPVIFELKNIVIVLGTIYALGFLASLIASGTVSKKLVE